MQDAIERIATEGFDRASCDGQQVVKGPATWAGHAHMASYRARSLVACNDVKILLTSDSDFNLSSFCLVVLRETIIAVPLGLSHAKGWTMILRLQPTA